MRRLIIITFIILVLIAGYAYAQMDGGKMGKRGQMGEGEMMGEKGEMAEMAHGFPHPFLNHMGIPDMVGMVTTRITGYRQGHSGEKSTEDYCFHLEASVYNRLGLHVRNNAIKQSPRTDVMLMYAVLQDTEAESGVSVFGGALIPSGTIPEGQDDVIGAFGVAARKGFKDIAIFDGNVHYMPEMEMAEIGLSGVFKATEFLFPILEIE